ncbi:MAG: hypothetical protein COV30_01235 [Candidatus Yanofskybacteria bacterium CG10_big_fil_rev_8_21_14_0_10_37_15]|uniref:Glycosyl transferase family 1 domain-containing protein n=1 Tax=Candidatus Yanofskybacteria bacterium CG10_big_fil_rev_8_21_14_0_10_37_15 TaxID=1975097 RepID=A0A2H0R5P5_9BACT|nr:MAG: hypothetical protein COV30_01235 [Candidatus Yanofskybacteria bacterium CG10_big_fil_rev_8_21_14_0_10_37_15]
MKNLLIISQKVDEGDDLLGFFIDWIREFSKNFNKVFVISLLARDFKLPDNVYVYSLGKENGASKLLQAIRFYKFLIKLTPKVSGVFAHMSPVFVIAAWPVTFIFRKKIILWYLHRSVTLRLRIAGKLCYKIVTAAKESLRFKNKKIIETGHGISVDKFKAERNWPEKKTRILSVGRISKIKNYNVLLKAVEILRGENVVFNVKIVGQPIMKNDFFYLEYLKSLKERLHLDSLVEFVGSVSYERIPEFYKDSDIVVGLTPDGGVDKTILEGMASGCLVLTSNTVNKKYFGLYENEFVFNYGDERDLAEKLESLINLSSNEKKERSEFLIRSVYEHHRLENTINRISVIL